MEQKRNESSTYKRVKKYLPEITKMIRNGVSYADIAKQLNISRSSINNWSKKYPEFAAAIDEGHQMLLDDIEGSLYKSCGIQTLTEAWYDENGELTKKFVKQVPANQRSIEYTLNNRRPDKWKSDTKSIDISLSEQMREKLKDIDVNDLIAIANLDLDAISEDSEDSKGSEE